MTTKKLRNEMFKEIEGIVKVKKGLIKTDEKTLVDITEKITNDDKKDILKTEYLNKEKMTLTNNIILLKIYVDLLEDTKEEIKKEEKTLFILS